jgi:aminoglycoside 3-N-acetyltransferase
MFAEDGRGPRYDRVEMTRETLAAQARSLAVRAGGVLLVHTSFRSVGPVEGGPLALIAALRDALGPSGTLVMPTMTDGASPFDPATTPTSGMGITAELFWRQPDVTRSDHPGASFAAAGPRAREICAPQPLSPPHGPASPVGRVHALGGQVLLIGVGHSENTTLHLAESLAGVPYSVSHPCVVLVDGLPQTLLIAETDHCCRRFNLLDQWLRDAGRQHEGRIGRAHARLCESSDIVETAVRRLRTDPLIFLCAPGEGCGECDCARDTAAPGQRARNC